jgi:hypothetical protein
MMLTVVAGRPFTSMMADVTNAFPHRTPIQPFSLFVLRNKEHIEQENPGCSKIEILQKLSAAWAFLSPDEKAAYMDDGMPAFGKFSGFGGFGYDDGPVAGIDSQSISEAVVNAASKIAALEQPADPPGFLSWLGARVVNEHVAAHGQLPAELLQQLEKGEFGCLPSSKELSVFVQHLRCSLGASAPGQ